MNELVKFLKSEGCGTIVLIALGVSAIGFAYHKVLQIKVASQQIKLNDIELEKTSAPEEK